MRIGFIGAGKVGSTFGKYIASKMPLRAESDASSKMDQDKNKPEDIQLEIGGYYSASCESARAAAEFTDTVVYNSLEELCRECEIIFPTVPDGQIESVWRRIKDLDIRGRIICHASGAMTSDIFSGITEAGAFGYSIHPMYAISSTTKSYREMQKCFFTVEGAEEWGNKLCRFTRLLGNDCVLLSTENKTKYHAAAVFASNLVNGLYGSAVSLLEDCGFEKKQAEQALVPLFMGNASHIAEDDPVTGLTGPSERNDTTTVKKHLNVLDANEKHIYISVSGAVLALAEQKYPDRDYSEMKKILSGQE